MWPRVSSVIQGIQCDPGYPVWSRVSSVIQGIQCDPGYPMWPRVSNVTQGIQCDSGYPMWPRVSNVTQGIQCDPGYPVWSRVSSMIQDDPGSIICEAVHRAWYECKHCTHSGGLECRFDLTVEFELETPILPSLSYATTSASPASGYFKQIWQYLSMYSAVFGISKFNSASQSSN